MTTKTVTWSISEDITVTLPRQASTLGQDVIDVTKLGQHGYFTFDPGFVSTAACESKITYIDGDQGILLHCGYPIEQLAEHSNFLEVSALLLSRSLPSREAFGDFKASLREQQTLSPAIINMLQQFPRDAHPMGMLTALVGALASAHHDFDPLDAAARLQAAHSLIAKIPLLAAMCYRHLEQQPIITPNSNISYAANFLHMMFGENDATASVNPVLAAALDRIFILHADHEQNASTSTVRLCGSSGVNPYAAVAAGIATLWGPAHGGANEAALNMLKEIGHPGEINRYIAKAKDKNDPFRLMGFGHRVYKNFDPRATVMRQACHDVLALVKAEDNPLLDIAIELEAIALKDDYFIERKLYPNIDFYSGITLSALGIPTSMFTAIFALARTAGWMAHWHEMWQEGTPRIGRPRQWYTGPMVRDYVELEAR